VLLVLVIMHQMLFLPHYWPRTTERDFESQDLDYARGPLLLFKVHPLHLTRSVLIALSSLMRQIVSGILVTKQLINSSINQSIYELMNRCVDSSMTVNDALRLANIAQARHVLPIVHLQW
jgi:hypothetical protein